MIRKEKKILEKQQTSERQNVVKISEHNFPRCFMGTPAARRTITRQFYAPKTVFSVFLSFKELSDMLTISTLPGNEKFHEKFAPTEIISPEKSSGN